MFPPKLKVQILPQQTAPEKMKVDVLFLPVLSDGDLSSSTADVDRALKGLIRKRAERDKFKGESEKTLWIDAGDGGPAHILLIGLGKSKEIKRSAVRDAFGSAASEVASRKLEKIGLAPFSDPILLDHFDAALEGTLLSLYRFDKYRSESNGKLTVQSIEVSLPDSVSRVSFQRAAGRVEAIVRATFLARDLINEPANAIHPESMEEIALAVAKDAGLKSKVFQEGDLKKAKMNLILAVGTGSQIRPRMVHLEYRPKGKVRRTIALVGKGVTFDSGGLSLKPQNNMYGMKTDMGGAAAVLSAAWAAAELKLPVHLHAIFPLVENLPSSHSVKPGDVVIAANGKSVEIENTDAEGRLILADALTYADSLKPDVVVDVATLTGSCVVALGEDIAGIFTYDDALSGQILSAGERAGEKFWRMPMEPTYKRLLKGDVSDLKNVGGKFGGSITAALFLAEFTKSKRWAHLDIAGPATFERDSAIGPKGASGFSVRTFVEWLSE